MRSFKKEQNEKGGKMKLFNFLKKEKLMSFTFFWAIITLILSLNYDLIYRTKGLPWNTFVFLGIIIAAILYYLAFCSLPKKR